MTTISEVRDGLQTVGATVTGLRVHDTAPGEIVPPALVVLPDSSDPRTLTGTRDSINYRLRLVLSNESTRTAQDALDGYLSSTGATSIRAAINANKNLGIPGVKATWLGWENYGLNEWAGLVYFGADVLVNVAS